ncbi:MAG TPA: xanthine dehydrogenase family protein subunit M [Candidatus Limnocylindrales bacterium]|nr:xanthine dehydrogenase family protein subunit M [Candidatus Limnocylindrales bacterium]
MHPFAYARPATLAELFALLDEHGDNACLLAGGTDLVVELRNRSRQPAVVIDLKRVRELQPGIREDADWVRISATSVMADIEDDPVMRTRFPALAEAAATVGSIQIRNRATLAGNICHASPAADTLPALLVYGAQVDLASGRRSRRLPLDEFLLGRGSVALRPGELLTSIALPIQPDRHGAAFARITRRRGVDLATINLCCLVDTTGRTRFAYGAVGPRAFLVADESGRLAAPETTDAIKDELLLRLIARASPISDLRGSREYRQAMLLVMSRRALRTALHRLAPGPA